MLGDPSDGKESEGLLLGIGCTPGAAPPTRAIGRRPENDRRRPRFSVSRANSSPPEASTPSTHLATPAPEQPAAAAALILAIVSPTA
jgi:hypothetical protein